MKRLPTGFHLFPHTLVLAFPSYHHVPFRFLLFKQIPFFSSDVSGGGKRAGWPLLRVTYPTVVSVVVGARCLYFLPKHSQVKTQSTSATEELTGQRCRDRCRLPGNGDRTTSKITDLKEHVDETSLDLGRRGQEGIPHTHCEDEQMLSHRSHDPVAGRGTTEPGGGWGGAWHLRALFQG